MTTYRQISSGTQSVLLLCAHFAPKEQAAPLELRELNRLVAVLEDRGLTVSALLDGDSLDERDWIVAKLDRDRVMRLIGRGAAMALAVERWTSAGLWIVARGEDHYPSRLVQHLGRSAPPLLFGVGDPRQLERGGLAIVGSRDVDESGDRFTAKVARQCAREGLPVVSGGARGVDEIALAGAFEEGGEVVAVLPEGLGRASVAAKFREGLRQARLVLVSPYAPHAGFTVGNAMGRNRLIYACADAALVVASAFQAGGTWAGAEEELRRGNPRPVYVRAVPLEGNQGLMKIGALPFPEEASRGAIRDLLDGNRVARIADAALEPARVEAAGAVAVVEDKPPMAFDEALARMLEVLAQPRTAKELADALGVPTAQAKQWIDRAIAEKRIVKSGRPARLRRPDEPQSSLFS